MIHILSSDTINKIAAGEVIERPVSVVKELVENSIDAAASAIVVEVIDGGIELIRVSDNGSGIQRSDIKNVFRRHATSKLESADDLFDIKSLGFRGEAMSSIAAVSTVELTTKTADDKAGIFYKIEGGREAEISDVGVPNGTTVVVKNIFESVPVRRKFLKNPRTEGAYITSFMEKQALVRPDISFKFILNGKQKLFTTGNGSLKDVIYGIYGGDIAKNIIEVFVESEDISISGCIGKPYISRGNRAFENYWVNGRFISNPAINEAIEEAYKGYIMLHSFPFTALSFEINPALIDVNVHPAKKEMRLRKAERVGGFIREVLRQSITGSNVIPDVSGQDGKKEVNDEKLSYIKYENAPEKPDLQDEKKGEEKDFTEMKQLQIQLLDDVKETEASVNIIKELDYTEGYDLSAKKKEADREYHETFQDRKDEKNFIQVAFETKKTSYRVIGQLFKTYWLIEADDTFYMMDQHAAHEKVLFEKLMKRVREKKPASQGLVIPVVISSSPESISLLEENPQIFEVLEGFGFQLEIFGAGSVKMNAVPADLPPADYRQMLIDILDGLGKVSGELSSDILEEKIASMSCKAAIKGNDAIGFSAAEKLIEDLMKAENPYNCPHGRPTLIAMSKYEIEKKFKRIL